VKSKILTLLKNKQPGFVSGEEISQLLGVSRTAIWKHIQSLKEDGYQMDSVSRQGYRLLSVPDRLYPQEIQEGLKTNSFGQNIIHFEQVLSTNDVAKELAGQGLPEGSLVVAEEQTGGKGRLGRFWSSPHGQGVWISLVLRPLLSPLDAPRITIMAAVAVAKTISEITNLTPGIKWPNDILYQGRKLAGILTEMSAEMDSVNFVILGIGVNVNTPSEMFPPEIRSQAVSLLLASGRKVSRVLFLQRLLVNLENLYGELMQGHFNKILNLWRGFSVTLGSWVTVTGLNQIWEGKAIDIDETGALIVADRQGQQVKVMAGDVTIRGLNGQH